MHATPKRPALAGRLHLNYFVSRTGNARCAHVPPDIPLTSMDPVDSTHLPRFPGGLTKQEYFWRDHQPWLEACGYALRSRYKPDWKPSWEGTQQSYDECEDGEMMGRGHLLDAVRISDGKQVMLKKILKSEHPREAAITQMFSSSELASDPRNHCVPLLELLQDPDDEDTVFLVLPFLREYHYPPFDTIGEVIEFLRQTLEGIHFMHINHVAHRDCMDLNIMMDASSIYPNGFHPIDQLRTPDYKHDAKHVTRTERPTKYYLIDFGLSREFDPNDSNPLATPVLSGDKTVPEFQDQSRRGEPQNPFPTDIYYVGNVVREDFLMRYHGLEFLENLVSDMVRDDPAKRPSMDEIVSRFAEVRSKLRSWQLRARLVEKRESGLVKFLKDIRHVFRTVKFVVRRYPSVPTPSSC